MTTMKVTLPYVKRAVVEGQAAAVWSGDAGQVAWLQGLLDEGLGSGAGERSLSEIRDVARRRTGADP